jgi:hypothetical protein
MEETYRPGKAEIKRLRLYRYDTAYQDIIPQLLEFAIYESIFGTFMQAEFVINDSIGLINSFPIVGDELIEIWFKTPGEDYQTSKALFRVVEVTNRTRTQDRSEMYTLNCTSPANIKDQEADVIGAHTGTPDQIATKIYENYLQYRGEGLGHIEKPLKVWNADNTVHYAGIGMRPTEFIDTLAAQAYNSVSNPETGEVQCYSDYVFFERMDGFWFYPLSAMKQGFAGLGDSIFMGTANREGTDQYKDPFLEIQSKAEKKVKRFEQELKSGKLKGIADQLEKSGKDLLSTMKDLINGVGINGERASNSNEPNRGLRQSKATVAADYTWLKQGGVNEANEAGMFRNCTEVIDTITKTKQVYDFNYERDFDQIPHVGSKPRKVISNDSVWGQQIGDAVQNVVVGFISNALGGNAGTGSYKDQEGQPYMSKINSINDIQLSNAFNATVKRPLRDAAFAMLDFFALQTTIPGDSRMKAGMVVDFYATKASGYSDDQTTYDKQMANGDDAAFLVGKVMHHYKHADAEYHTTVTLMKDAAANIVDSDNLEKDTRIRNKAVENTISGKVIPIGQVTKALGEIDPRLGSIAAKGLSKGLSQAQSRLKAFGINI